MCLYETHKSILYCKWDQVFFTLKKMDQMKCVICCYSELSRIDLLCWQPCWAAVIMLQQEAVAETSHDSIFALLLYSISGFFFVSPSRVRLMHCTLLFSVIQKKSLSLDPQGAVMVSRLQSRWQQTFIKANACVRLLTAAQSSQTHMYTRVFHIYHISHATLAYRMYAEKGLKAPRRHAELRNLSL